MGQDREDGAGDEVSMRNLYADASAPARHSRDSAIMVDDIRNPGDAFIQAELDANRRHEWLLVPKAIIAFAVVGALVVIRQLFFV